MQFERYKIRRHLFTCMYVLTIDRMTAIHPSVTEYFFLASDSEQTEAAKAAHSEQVPA